MDRFKNDCRDAGNLGLILAEAFKHKANIGQLWKSENDAEAAFRTNGCVVGLCWDSTGFNMRKKFSIHTSRRKEELSLGTKAIC